MSELYLMPLQACKDSQQDPDFCVIARVEALIAGHGMEEALRRANAYREAGNRTYICLWLQRLFAPDSNTIEAGAIQINCFLLLLLHAQVQAV